MSRGCARVQSAGSGLTQPLAGDLPRHGLVGPGSVIGPLWQALGWAGLAWLLGGGVLYTLGVLFYVAKERIRHSHGIWHLFVLGGSACHFVALLLYLNG